MAGACPREFYGNFYGEMEFRKRMDPSNAASTAYSQRTARPQIDYYPVSHHPTRNGIARPDQSASSHFQFTQPSVKGSFVIHPQFVSEHCEFSKRLKSTKNLSHLTATPGDSGLRYGSASSGV
ncbi:hypothetical protein EB796_010030 [Bugula neritina]|uniref:Uncharacterized protein n=1 Tax=Bugula neritina TaxID=10212 RepID=A0A7J7K0A0_BUGNE|nr:hypothetical protein EB796_010030 [Bugula neritina]